MLREGRLQRLVRVQGTRLMAEITAVIPYTCVALCYLHRGVVGRISHHLHLEIERCSLHREPRDGTLAFPKLPLGERLETIVLALGAGKGPVRTEQPPLWGLGLSPGPALTSVWRLIPVLICVSLRISDAEHLSFFNAMLAPCRGQESLLSTSRSIISVSRLPSSLKTLKHTHVF